MKGCALISIDCIEQLDVVHDRFSEPVPLSLRDVLMEEILLLNYRHLFVPQVLHREVSLGHVASLVMPSGGPRFVEVLSRIFSLGS